MQPQRSDAAGNLTSMSNSKLTYPPPARMREPSVASNSRFRVQAQRLPFPFGSPTAHRRVLARATPLLAQLEAFIYDDGVLFCRLDGAPAASFRQGEFLLRCHRTIYGENLQIEAVPLLINDHAVLCAHPDVGLTVLHLVRYLRHEAAASEASAMNDPDPGQTATDRQTDAASDEAVQSDPPWNVDLLLCERATPLEPH